MLSNLTTELATLVDNLVGASAQTGTAITGPGTPNPPGGNLTGSRANHPHPNSEILGRLLQSMLGRVPELAFGTHTVAAAAVALTATLGFRPDIVIGINDTGAAPALVVHVRGMVAGAGLLVILAAATEANSFTLTDTGFTLPAANASLNVNAETFNWIAIGMGGGAVALT